MLLDIFTKKNIIGIVKCERLDDENNVIETIFQEKNLIVSDSGYLFSRFMAGEDIKGIKYIVLGDMNLDESDDLKNVRPPSCNDYELENEVFRKEVDVETYEDVGGYGVTFSIVLEKDECNGSNGEQLITEYGLLSESVYKNTGNDDKDDKNIMFSRKTRAAIYKNYEMRLKFSWTIYFKKTCDK